MAKTETTKTYVFLGDKGLGGGLVSENPLTLAENQMVIADNLLVATTLARRKRGGQEKYHTGTFDLTPSYPVSGVPVRGIIDYWRTASLSGNPVSDVFLHQGSKVWSIDDRNTVGVDRTGALVLDPDAVPSYQPFNQRVYFCSTVTSDGYNKWDGASASAVSAVAPPDGVGKYLTTHLGRMVMAGQDDFPFRVYLSAPLDPENWTSGGATSLDFDDNGDPEGVTGIASFQSRLYIFTRQSIYELTGFEPADFVVTKISSGIGCIAHASITQTPNDILFASDRGVHSLRQIASGKISESTFLSKDIQRLWTTLINTALFKRVMATFDDTINCYVVSIPSSGQTKNDSILLYNIEFGIWFVWPTLDTRSLSMAFIGNKKRIIAGKEDGKIALLNGANYSDFGDGYSYRFKTGVIYPGDPSREKAIKSITIFASTETNTTIGVGWEVVGKDAVKASSASVDLSQAIDVLGSTFVLGSSRLGIGQFKPITIPIDDVGYGVQIEISAGGKTSIEFYGFMIEAEDYNENYR